MSNTNPNGSSSSSGNSACPAGQGALPTCGPFAVPFVVSQSPTATRYSKTKALENGTLFQDLNLPFHLKVNAPTLADTQLNQLRALDFAIQELSLLTAYHSVPFWVYLAFGLSGQSAIAVVGLQAVLFLSVSSLPLPGAVGLTEGGFLLLYQTVFPAAILPSAMLLSRTVSFYLVLLCCGLVIASRFLQGSWQALAPKKPPAVRGEH